MIARLSALDAPFAPRGPQEGIMGKTLRIIIDPKVNRTTSMSSIARPVLIGAGSRRRSAR
jgi:hypothetical protein